MATGQHSGLQELLEEEKPQQRQARTPLPCPPRKAEGAALSRAGMRFSATHGGLCPLLPDKL